jgi:hypothetical protein
MPSPRVGSERITALYHFRKVGTQFDFEKAVFANAKECSRFSRPVPRYPYSMDLRKRVVAAVVTGGLSCNGAAEQQPMVSPHPTASRATNLHRLVQILRVKTGCTNDDVYHHATAAVAGLTFWVCRKRLVGSYFSLS